MKQALDEYYEMTKNYVVSGFWAKAPQYDDKLAPEQRALIFEKVIFIIG